MDASDHTKRYFDELLNAYVFQRSKLMESHGIKPPANFYELTSKLCRDPLTKSAELIAPWDVPAGVVMEAAFSYAKSLGHASGPMLNMLSSEKYIVNALSRHFALPAEVVKKATSRTELIRGADQAFADASSAILRHLKDDPSKFDFLTTYPAVFRLYVAMLSGRGVDSMMQLARDAIMEIEHDQVMLEWLRSRNITYDQVAEIANQRKVTVEPLAGLRSMFTSALRLLDDASLEREKRLSNVIALMDSFKHQIVATKKLLRQSDS